MLRRLGTAVLLTLGCTLAQAAPVETPEAALARFLDKVQSVEAGFTQIQTDDRGRADAPSTGRMALSRPGKFRWEYREPAGQLIVTDGAKLWLYDADLKQVTVRPAAEALEGTPAALLSQRKTLTDAFTLSDDGTQGPENAQIRKLRLVPKAKESDFKDVSLWLDKAGAPVRMVFRDQLGGSTDIAFTGVKTNGRLSAGQFTFAPPKGTEVIQQP